MLIYGPFGSRTLLTRSYKNSENIGLLKKAERNLLRPIATYFLPKIHNTIFGQPSNFPFDLIFSAFIAIWHDLYELVFILRFDKNRLPLQ